MDISLIEGGGMEGGGATDDMVREEGGSGRQKAKAGWKLGQKYKGGGGRSGAGLGSG